MCISDDPVGSVLLNLTWLLNASVVVLACFLLFYWSSLTWILGSAAYSTLMEIFGLGFMVYILLGGAMLLGSTKNIRSGYFHLHRSRSCHGAMLLIPFFAFGFFLTVSLLALLVTPVTTSYLKTHSDKVFEKADTNADGMVDFYEFSHYVLSLPDFKNSNSTEFSDHMADVFDEMDKMDNDVDGFIHEPYVYAAAYSSLAPSRKIFGICAAVLCGVICTLTLIWWYWFNRLHREVRLSRSGARLVTRKAKKGSSSKRKPKSKHTTNLIKPKTRKGRRSKASVSSASSAFQSFSASAPPSSTHVQHTHPLHSQTSSLALRHGEFNDLIVETPEEPDDHMNSTTRRDDDSTADFHRPYSPSTSMQRHSLSLTDSTTMRTNSLSQHSGDFTLEQARTREEDMAQPLLRPHYP